MQVLVINPYPFFKMTVYGTTEHQNLVLQVMSSRHTAFYPKWNSYITFYFCCEDPENFGRIEDEDLDDFTQKVRDASAKLLELQKEKTKV